MRLGVLRAHSSILFILSLSFLFLMAGCSDDSNQTPPATNPDGDQTDEEPIVDEVPDETACEPLTFTPCVCPVGAGIKYCKNDGSGYDPCQCSVRAVEMKPSVMMVDEQTTGEVIREGREGLSVPMVGNEAMLSLEEGELLWSWQASWGGKVSKVEVVEDRIFIELEDAALAELFDKLDVEFSGKLNLLAHMPDDYKRPIQERLKRAAKNMKDEDDNDDTSGGLPAGMSVNIEGDLELGVELVDGSYLDISPNIFFRFSFDASLANPVKHLVFVPVAELDMKLITKIDVKAASKATVDWELVKFIFDVGGAAQFYPPWIPIPNTCFGLETYAHVGCSLELDSHVQAEPSLSVSAAAYGGVAYSKDWSDCDFTDAPDYVLEAKKNWSNDTWETLGDGEFYAEAEFNSDEFKWGAHGGVECYLMPKIALTVARAVGPTLSDQVYARFDAYVGDKNYLAVSTGARVNVGGKVDVLGFASLWEDSWEVWSFKRELWRYSWLACGDGYRNLGCEDDAQTCGTADCPPPNCDDPPEECDAGEWEYKEGQPSPWRPESTYSEVRCIPHDAEEGACTCAEGWVPVDSTPIEDFVHDWRWGHGNNWCVPSCGNGVHEEDEGEVCDDGNTLDFVGDCAADCQSTQMCGDGVLHTEMGEVCDDGNTEAGDGCRADCRGEEECGDNFIDHAAGEECDDGNDVDCDECTNGCQRVTGCGDGAVCGDEECDEGGTDAFYDDCDGCAFCRLMPENFCGDGVRCGAEFCDDGNDNDCDECTNGCIVTSGCGDGAICGDEVCDDGNRLGGDGCNPACSGFEVCGDGYQDWDVGEECDDGNDNECDDCHSDCTRNLNECGDGYTCGDEVCDDGNHDSGDGCRVDCMGLEECGDGILDRDVGEVCDDGNTDSGDGCKGDCSSDESCGNGIVDEHVGELCDDGNTFDNDGCRGDCMGLEICGDGYVDVGEQCEDTTEEGVDLGCSEATPDCILECSACSVRCGDGVLGTGEVCEVNPDGIDFGCTEETPVCDSICRECLVDCSDNVCGDGKVCDDEACDDGNTDDCMGDCSGDCMTLLTGCGDGVTCGDEVCDDGNALDGDGCRADCMGLEVCGDGLLDTAAGEGCEDTTEGSIDLGCSEGSPDCVAPCSGCTPRCGDGVIGTGEACEDSTLEGMDNGCSAEAPICYADCSQCTTHICGNEIVEGEEVCDTNDVACMTAIGGYAGFADCHESCFAMGECITDEYCGDGIVNGNEVCDDGDNDSCTRACSDDCMHADLPEESVCGDGVLECDEVCDDGNTSDGDGCNYLCNSDETCGNGFVDTRVGEACDDGNTTNGDGCRADCLSDETCGNGQLDDHLGEVCDDGNTSDCRGDCAADCSGTREAPVCGDDFVDTDCEVCENTDTSNTTVDEGCSESAPNCNDCDSCSSDVCGDGIVGASEDCDEGGLCDGEMPACTTLDTSACDPGEECLVFLHTYPDGGKCHTDCTYSKCGNGVVEENEQCEDTDSGEGIDEGCWAELPFCQGNCLCTSSICGDGFVTAPDEACEDTVPDNSGIDEGCDAMNPDCQSNCYGCTDLP